MTGALLVCAVLAAAEPAGAAPPVAATATATAPAPAAPPWPAEPVRIERRLLEKRGRFFGTAGAGWLARGDYYSSPALTLSVSRYLLEGGGVELRAAAFASRLDAAAEEVRRATGLVPDAQRPVGLVVAAWRQSAGYGKALVSPALGVLHFDLQLSAGGGALFTDRAVAPVVAAGPAVLARLGGRLVAQLDVVFQASFERRAHASVSPGVLATLGVGAWL